MARGEGNERDVDHNEKEVKGWEMERV